MSPPGPGRILVVGATSGIAEALCHRFAGQGAHLVLAARDERRLRALKGQLETQNPSCEVECEIFDALDFQRIPDFVSRSFTRYRAFDAVVVCYGTLPVQSETEQDAELTRQAIETNYTSVVLLLNQVAPRMAEQLSGQIVVISSVAGDRGRRSNYLYGSTKAALSTFLQGLRSRLHPHGVHVLTVKPGYVATKMIDGRVDRRSRLVATPERVARDIVRAMRRRRNVIYTPWYWRIILGFARSLPEFLFKRLSF